MSRIHANNFGTTIDGAISDSDTSVILTSITGFPSIGAGVTCNLTLQSGSTIEIVTATARTSNTLTITRGAESTTPVAWADGASISIRPTADSVDRKLDIADLTESAQDAVGAMVDTTLVYTDGTPLLSRAALTGDVTASAGSNATTIATPSSATIATDDKVLIKDTSASDATKYVTAQSIADLSSTTKTAISKVVVGGNSTASGYIELLEDTDNGSNKLTITGQQSMATDKTVTFQDITGTVYVTSGTDVSVDDGGTGRSTATAYAPLFGGTTSTGAHQSGTAGTSGQLLQSGGSSAVAGWTTATYPTTAGTTGKLLQSDGTNFVSSSATWPTAATNTKFIIGNGTNYVESTSTIPTSAGSTANKYLKSDGTNYVLSTATISDSPSTSGKILVSDGTNWITSTPTFPNSSATTRKIIVSDGTNWVASTETYAVPGSSGNVLRSDGTNWVAGKAVLTTDVTGVLPNANGGSIVWNTSSGTTQAAAVNNGYVCTNASQNTITLPATAAVGDIVAAVSQGAGGWKLTANTGQTVKGLNDTTTSAGNITHSNQYDTIEVICVVANTTWVIRHFTSALLTFA